MIQNIWIDPLLPQIDCIVGVDYPIIPGIKLVRLLNRKDATYIGRFSVGHRSAIDRIVQFVGNRRIGF